VSDPLEVDEGGPGASFEEELRQFAPAAASAGLRARVAAGMEGERLRASDRLLAGVMTLGAAAAVVIVTLVGADWVNARARPGVAGGGDLRPLVEERRALLAQLAASGDRLEVRGPAADAGRAAGP
jgi:hypothetical protein